MILVVLVFFLLSCSLKTEKDRIVYYKNGEPEVVYLSREQANELIKKIYKVREVTLYHLIEDILECPPGDSACFYLSLPFSLVITLMHGNTGNIAKCPFEFIYYYYGLGEYLGLTVSGIKEIYRLCFGFNTTDWFLLVNVGEEFKVYKVKKEKVRELIEFLESLKEKRNHQ